MAPEYAMRGCLTSKADVYSFGVVALEIVSGKSNTNYRPKEEYVYLLDWVNNDVLLYYPASLPRSITLLFLTGLCITRKRMPAGTRRSCIGFGVFGRRGNADAECGSLVHECIAESPTNHVASGEYVGRPNRNPRPTL